MNRNFTKRWAMVMLALGIIAAAAGTEESGTDRGWRTLFNGENFDGWELRGGGDEAPIFSIEDGAIVGRTLIPRNKTGFLATKEQFRDFELLFEIKIDDKLNSGVQVRSTPEGNVRGAQVEIESGFRRTGFIFLQGGGQWLSEDIRGEGEAFKKGEWNQFRVLVKGNTIKTWINGKPIEDLTSDKISPEGVIALQVHGYPRGKLREQGSDKVLKAAWRNIRIREMGD